MTEPYPLPKRVLSEVRSNASSISFHYLLFLFEWGHPVATCVFFLVFPSLLPFLLSPWITRFKRQFMCKMWPFQLVLLHFIVSRTWLASLALCNVSLFLIRSVQLIFYILHQHHASKTFQVFLIYFPKCSSFSATQRCAPNVALYYIFPPLNLNPICWRKESFCWTMLLAW